MTVARRVAILGGNRIPFARSGTAYARASNHEMLSATLQGLIVMTGLWLSYRWTSWASWLADTLGVHYMTAYRYVRHGLLPAKKVGGTWRVTVADLEAFRNGATGEVPAGESRRRKAPWAERLEARLLAGDGHGAWGVIEMAMSSGASLDEVYLDVISPAMESIGARWAAGNLDVAAEHRATGIAFRLIGRLGPRFARPGRSRSHCRCRPLRCRAP